MTNGASTNNGAHSGMLKRKNSIEITGNPRETGIGFFIVSSPLLYDSPAG
jgi:hypothetical protein